MMYAIVSLSGEGKLPETARKECSAVYDKYAPRAWFVLFDGTTKELTDLVWPDDQDDESFSIPAGIVVRLTRTNNNGFASYNLWDWIEAHGNGRG